MLAAATPRGAGRFALAFALYLPVLLWLDVDSGLAGQALLAVATTLLLAWTLRPLEREARLQVYACIAVSTAIELFSTQVWGVYAYRLGNVPLFVPPGHGLICAVAIHAARTGFFTTHRRALVFGTLAVATLAAFAGLFVLPRFGRTVDVEGALFLPGFAFLLLRTARASEHAVTFFLATWVEVWGVFFANWEWAGVLPWLEVASGNPPTVAAGGYCWFSAIAVFLLARASRPARVLTQRS